jgi:hypothetical protein
MISANYSCVICKLLFDTTTELKVHILNAHENDYSCLQCRVKFGTYQELLAHKLTFCKYPVLLTECIWCIKPSSECVCAKIQPFVTETMQDHIRGRIDCKIISNNMFSIFFFYACEKGTLKASNPKFEVNDLKDFTKESVHALITDLCPMFEFTNSGHYPNIICAEWEINSVPWASVKCRLQPYFNNFMEVLGHINEISIKYLHCEGM